MDPATQLLIPGILGGVVIALLLHFANRHATLPVPMRSEPLSTDIINAAHIKVAGVGGLGLFAMAMIVAFVLPEVRRSLGIGLTAGAALAVALILFNRPRS